MVLGLADPTKISNGNGSKELGLSDSVTNRNLSAKNKLAPLFKMPDSVTPAQVNEAAKESTYTKSQLQLLSKYVKHKTSTAASLAGIHQVSTQFAISGARTDERVQQIDLQYSGQMMQHNATTGENRAMLSGYQKAFANSGSKLNF